MYRSAEVLRESRNLARYGLDGSPAKANIAAIQKRKNGIVTKLREGVLSLFQANKIDYFEGTGSFLDAKTVHVALHTGATEEITADHIVIATGSSPKRLAIPGSDLPHVITTDELLEIDHIPKRLGVIGAGTVGTEFASIFNALGSDVTVVVKYDRVMRKLDLEMVYEFMKSFKEQGIHMVEGVLPQRLEKTDNGLVIISKDLKSEKEVSTEVDEILLSAGRKANTVGLNLEKAGVKTDKCGFVMVDKNYRTNVDGIYAIGDVIGKQMLAHVASTHGIKLVESIVNHTDAKPMTPVPDCVFAFPEIATCGISEEYAKEQKLAYRVGRFSFAANGKAMALGETEGLVKVIADKKGTILGVNICGPHASDLIAEATTAMTAGLSVDDLIDTIHAHPTLIETFSEALMDVEDKSIHSAPKCNFHVIDSDNSSDISGKIRLPKLNDLMSTGRICGWNFKVGDYVKKGDVLCTVESNKATGEIVAPMDGKLMELRDQQCETVEVGTIVCIMQPMTTEHEETVSPEITMPKLNDLMSEGIISSWKVGVGDLVEKGQLLCTIEAIKATGEILAPRRGTITAINVDEGGTAAVGAVVALLS